jgi:hypothetical protein
MRRDAAYIGRQVRSESREILRSLYGSHASAPNDRLHARRARRYPDKRPDNSRGESAASLPRYHPRLPLAALDYTLPRVTRASSPRFSVSSISWRSSGRSARSSWHASSTRSNAFQMELLERRCSLHEKQNERYSRFGVTERLSVPADRSIARSLARSR